MNFYERVCATVDLDAIEQNVANLYQNLNADCKMVAVVKADAYGHGALPIARHLESADMIEGFATATAEEALVLRRCGIKKTILILGYTFPYSYKELIEEEIELTVFREDTLAQLSEIATRLGKKAYVHVKVDTGMHRIGILPDESGLDFMKKLLQYDNIVLRGVFSHLATADETDKSAANEQIRVFLDFIKRTEECFSVQIPMKHCFNSAGIMDLKNDAFNIARIGIAMYGIFPSDDMQNQMELKPALSLRSHIVYIKTLPKGCPISYGGTFITKEETKVATIPVGYGDGYPRGLSNCGYVLIHGKVAPILGRVCMDQFMVDVTNIPEAKEGDMVTLIGRNGDKEITVESLCSLYGGFRYEMICDIGKRVPKEYYADGKMIYSKDYHDDLK